MEAYKGSVRKEQRRKLMRKPKQRSKGEVFRPIVEVIKTKNGTPTRIEMNGHAYILAHADSFQERKKK
jgi:hypothetical protein